MDSNLGKGLKKRALDKDLRKIERLEAAAHETGVSAATLGLGLLFLLGVFAVSALQAGGIESRYFVIAAGVIGGYMALNIGANDVANNMGPAVGSRALTMAGALAIAVIFEAAGAILAGGDVVETISKGIIDPGGLADSHGFILAMTAALLSAALWLNLATALNAPVSTTHAIVGAVMGAGIAAAGFDAVHWDTMGAIAASWVISPVLGGGIAALFLAFVKHVVIDQADRVAAARRWVPILVAVMSAAFAAYLLMKGFQQVWKPAAATIALLSAIAFAATWAAVRPLVRRASAGLDNRRKSVANLFRVPLICAAALLSFAHGANDVANAVGPLAAIVHVASSGVLATAVGVPLWVMLVGALGISIGLFLYGPKLIRMVGEKITRLNPLRGFCVALSAAITVIWASALGLPVSSTHIAVGAVFGVGFYREFVSNRRKRALDLPAAAPAWLDELHAEAEGERPSLDPAKAEKKLRKARKRRLVRRMHLLTIVAAWVVTVPLAALLAAALYLGLAAALS